MENSMSELNSPSFWSVISTITGFVLGKVSDILSDKFYTSKMKIDKYIRVDPNDNKPYIHVVNCGRRKILNAYDLHFHIIYYKQIEGKYQPVRDGDMSYGKLEADENRKFSVLPDGITISDWYSSRYKLHVTLLYQIKHRRNLLVEQECIIDTSPIIQI